MPKLTKRVDPGSWDRKKMAIIRNYHKTLKDRDAPQQIPVKDRKRENKGKEAFFKRAMHVYESKKAIIEENKKIQEAKQKEKKQAIKKYKKKKLENFKKLSQKTKFGQPVMRGRMEILLERIERTVAEETKK